MKMPATKQQYTLDNYQKEEHYITHHQGQTKLFPDSSPSPDSSGQNRIHVELKQASNLDILKKTQGRENSKLKEKTQ